MTCHLGDFPSYAALRNEIRDVEKEAAKARSASRRAEAAVSLEKLRPGDVIKIPAGRRSGYAIVIQGNKGGKKESASPTVLTSDAQVRRLTLMDVPTPVEPVMNLSLPKHFNARNAKSRKDLAATVRVKVPHDPPPARHTGSGVSQEVERVMSPATASELAADMQNVVDEGTGTAARLPSGLSIAGKTGTAETGTAGINTAWFIAFAPVVHPKIAVAVVVEHTPDFGGQISAPIAAKVIEAYLGAGVAK